MMDYGQLVMDAEIARMVKYCVPGIPVSDATLSVDVIHEIGPFKDFLSHEDTYRGMRGQSSSKLIDRRVREEWAAAGATSLYDRALLEARRILETHEPAPLSDEVARQLELIVSSAEVEICSVFEGGRQLNES